MSLAADEPRPREYGAFSIDLNVTRADLRPVDEDAPRSLLDGISDWLRVRGGAFDGPRADGIRCGGTPIGADMDDREYGPYQNESQYTGPKKTLVYWRTRVRQEPKFCKVLSLCQVDEAGLQYITG